MDSPLEQWRKALGLTQPELADLAKVSQGHISQVENGHVVLGEKLRAFLEKIGGDALRVIADHESYMDEVRDGLEDGLQAKMKREEQP